MTINITWQDIRAGKFMSTSHCMVALAIKRELGADYVSVGLDDVRIRVDGRYLTLRLPPEVGSKIRWWKGSIWFFLSVLNFPVSRSVLVPRTRWHLMRKRFRRLEVSLVRQRLLIESGIAGSRLISSKGPPKVAFC